MKIAYLADKTFPSMLASDVHIVRMCEALAKAGHDVTLFAYKDETKEFCIKKNYGINHDFKTIFIPRFQDAKSLFGRVMRRYREKLYKLSWVMRKFDLIYTRSPRYATQITHTPFVYECHNSPDRPNKIKKVNEIKDKKNLAAVVSITKALEEKLIEDFHFDPSIMLTAPDGATIPKENTPTVNDPLTIGYVGHLYDGRGIDIIIGLAEAFPSLNFVLAGGTDADVDRWKTLAETQKLKNISFLGYIPHAKLGNVYALLDIVLSPHGKKVRIAGNTGDISNYMSPLKIFEYMSFKKPMLVSDIPVLHEVLRNEETCLFCEPENLESWKTQLARLVNDRDLQVKLANQAYANFVNNYTWDARVKNIIEFAEAARFTRE